MADLAVRPAPAFVSSLRLHSTQGESNMRSFRVGCAIAALSAVTAFAPSSHAADVMATKTLGASKVELHLLPAEPFFTKDEVATKGVKQGMEIEGGAPPVMPDAASHPNHHLVVHVFDGKSGKPLTEATVAMKFAAMDRAGKPTGTSVDVPVAVMQAIGQGPASTHWGNNVSMPAGSYQVTVTVNGETGLFNVKASDAPSRPMGKMNMGKMKM
jgi:hypothetical protein